MARKAKLYLFALALAVLMIGAACNTCTMSGGVWMDSGGGYACHPPASAGAK